MDATNGNNEPAKKRGRPKGLPKTGGNKKGVPPKVTLAMKSNIAEFFKTCTAENVKWRSLVARILNGEQVTASQNFFIWSKLAMDRSLGLPGKYQAPKPEKEPFLFINYRAGHDPMAAKTTAMLEAKAQEERVLALEEGAREDPELIIAANAAAAAAKGKDTVAAEEQLEAVDMPVEDISAIRDMLTPQPSQYERDRLPKGER